MLVDSFVTTYVNAPGGVLNVDVSNKRLLISCSSARQKYHAYLEAEKKKNDNEEKSKKRKLIEDEIDILRRKRRAVEQDIESLVIDADNLAVRAEKELNISLVTKSNVMRRAAKEKTGELSLLSQQLDGKLLELKNCA